MVTDTASNVDAWRLGLEILEFLLTGAIGVYVYLSSKDTVTNDRIGKLEEDIDQKFGTQGERIASLETQGENRPTHGDLSEIHEKINGVSGEIKTLSGEFTGVKNLLNTIHSHLLNSDKS